MTVQEITDHLRKVLAATNGLELLWMQDGTPIRLDLAKELPPVLDRLAALEVFAPEIIRHEFGHKEQLLAWCCPECFERQGDGHAVGCKRAAAIAALKATGPQ